LRREKVEKKSRLAPKSIWLHDHVTLPSKTMEGTRRTSQMEVTHEMNLLGQITERQCMKREILSES
jgi:hypothetical protein